MEETQFDRAEALFEQFDLDDLSPITWQAELQRLADQGEDPVVLRFVQKSLQTHWLEQLSERLALLSPTERDAELEALLEKGLLSTVVIAQLRAQLNDLQSSEPRLYPGLVIDKYVLGEPLYTPEDGLSLVYYARQGNLERVIKFVHPQRLAADSADATAQFEQELRHLHVLDSIQGIVSAIDWGVYHHDNGSVLPYLVTHYIRDGIPITTYAQRNGLALEQRLELFARVCEAVRAAHGKGIVHRDLKPANILVDQAGQTWVIDFGLAYAWQPWVSSDDWAPSPGSRQYMSPEHIAPGYGSVGFHSDVYALGLILYELLVTARPYVVTSPSVITESVPLPIGAHSELYQGGALEKQLARALAKQPQERCSLQELQAVAIAYRAPQTADSVSTAATTPLHRRRFLLAIGIAVLLLGALAGGVLLSSRKGIPLAGVWQADIHYPWGIRCRERFEFERHSGEIQGTASFLGVPRALVSSQIDGNAIQFVTYSQEIMGAESPSKTVKRHYRGQVTANRIDFFMVTEGGYSESIPISFSARKIVADDEKLTRRCVAVK